jgi:hypothetical protein
MECLIGCLALHDVADNAGVARSQRDAETIA